MTKPTWESSSSQQDHQVAKNASFSPQSWFQRRTKEPSRQALIQLRQSHDRRQSPTHRSSKSSPRGSCLDEGSKHSRSRATESRGETRQPSGSSRGNSICSTEERPQSAYKLGTFLHDGLVRRSSSKLSMSSNVSGSFSRKPAHGRFSRTSVIYDPEHADQIRQSISLPFNFQHLTHAEPDQIGNLDGVTEMEIASRICEARSDGNGAHELKGISTINLHDASTVSLREGEIMFHKASSSTAPSLPVPRDHSPRRSTATIRPPSSLPLSEPCSTSLEKYRLVSAETARNINETSKLFPSITDEKPLPLLPLIHAVTTSDDTARALKIAPLPQIPVVLESEVPRTSLSAPLKGKTSESLRRAQASMPNFLSRTSPSSVSQLNKGPSDLMLLAENGGQYPGGTRPSSLESFMSWEAAIDDAWDQAEQEMNEASPWMKFHNTNSTSTSKHSSPILEHAQSVASSSNNSPLMMSGFESLHMPTTMRRASDAAIYNSTPLTSVAEEGREAMSAGLNISACPRSTALPVVPPSRSSSLRNQQFNPARSIHMYGHISRSSSQDSIALSLSSSTLVTQRSSSSSLNVSECSLPSHRQAQKTRPESGCLPQDIVGHSGLHEQAVHQTPFQLTSPFEDFSLPTTTAHTDRKPFAAEKILRSKRSESSFSRPRTPSTTVYSPFPKTTSTHSAVTTAH